MVCLEPKFSLLRDGKAELQGLSFGASDQPDL